VADLTVVDELRAYLIAQGVGQSNDPNVTPISAVVPSIWKETVDGAPEPRDGEAATITLIDTLAGPPSDLEAFMEETFVECVVRARGVASGTLLQRQIRQLIAPLDAPGGRKMWMMGALLVEYSTCWRGDQPAGAVAASTSWTTGRPSTVFSRTQSFRIGCRVKSLAGLPYAP
jgi:hypothetical protein